MPNVIRITESDAQRIRNTRSPYGRNRSAREAQRAIFRDLKQRYGIPSHLRLRVEIDNRYSDMYLVLRDKRSGEALHELAATPAPRQARPFPGADRVTGETANGHAPLQAPRNEGLAVGSIDLNDALELLRADADGFESYSTGQLPMPTSVVVKDGRLFFVQ